MNITQKLTLDLAKRSVFQYVYAKQGDHSSRFVKITLTNNGAIYTPPAGVTANFRAQKPDGTMILNQAVVNDDGTVTIELTQQALAVRGDVIADIFLTDVDGGILSSVSFVIHVDAVPDGTKKDSTGEFLVFMQMVERAESAAMKAEHFVENTADKSFVEKIVSVERARIDQIVAVPQEQTEGNAELIDIRVAADGKTYPSAGEAVRKQISQLSGEIDVLGEEVGVYFTTWEKGSLYDATGLENNHPSFSVLRTDFISTEKLFFVKLSNGFSCKVYKYNSNKEFTKEATIYNSDAIIDLNNSAYVRIIQYKTDFSDFTIAERTNVLLLYNEVAFKNNILIATGDETDVTNAIMNMLNSTGICNLGCGNFYISGLKMPDNSVIKGCGNKTNLILINELQVSALTVGKNCTIQDLTLTGSLTDFSFDDVKAIEFRTLRNGLYFPTATIGVPKIKGCKIKNFSGSGIRFEQTGLSAINSALIDNCDISNCWTGIFIRSRSEFHRFSHLKIHHCNEGVVNNAGNNIFNSCDFSHNVTGFIISSIGLNDDLYNEGHGSCIGCSFNHENDNTGNAILIKYNHLGFSFVGCQIFFGNVDIMQGVGTVFSGSLFGRSEIIKARNNSFVMLSDCLFYSEQPTLQTDSTSTLRINNSYMMNGDDLPSIENI